MLPHSSLLRAQQAAAPASGIAWEVRGSWRELGNSLPIVTGDAIQPGSLLQPDPGDANNSITILLSDGQRTLYECFTLRDCARGFRVPALYRTPEPFAGEMLARIRAALIHGNRLRAADGIHAASDLPREEAVAVLGADHQVRVAGLVTDLPNGRYTYDVQRLDRAYPRQRPLAAEKTAPFLVLTLPSAGLYVATITDAMNRPRIDLFVAAVDSGRAASIRASFGNAQALMNRWNSHYDGWPVHDFQRAYLESIVMNLKPVKAVLPASSSAAKMFRAGVTAEPSFSPRPGVFAGDTAVMLRCNTPGAVLRYTVDGSEPLAGSPVYVAPIIVKGTELTIKAYASAPGRKDSPVATGIFRIRQ